MLGPTGSQMQGTRATWRACSTQQWAPPTESAFLTSSQVMLPAGTEPHFEKLLPTYEILVTLLSCVGELGMHFHGAAGLSYGTTGPPGWAWFLARWPRSFVLVDGRSGDCRQSNLEARWLSDLGES